jgi:hypothetical protein
MRGRVGPVGIVVLPRPLVAHDVLEGGFEVALQRRVDVLVDRYPGSRMRDVDERGRGSIRPLESGPHLVGDVDDLRLSLRRYLELPHGSLSYATDVGPPHR